MQVLRRIALPLTNSLFVTAGLFSIMYSLIYMDEPLLPVRSEPIQLNWVEIPEDRPPVIMVPKPTPPELTDDTPKVPKVIIDDDIGELDNIAWSETPYTPGKQTMRVPEDNQLGLAIGFPPEYPSRAISRGIEGFAVVGFSVSEAGEVFDAYILESEPGTVFDKSALKAIKKFRYHARKVSGKPISTTGQRYMFTYELDS